MKLKVRRGRGSSASPTASGTGTSVATPTTQSGRLRCVPGAMDDTEKDSLKVMI